MSGLARSGRCASPIPRPRHARRMGRGPAKRPPRPSSARSATGGRIVSIGTTALRLLETVARAARRCGESWQRRDGHLHRAGLPLPRRRPPAHQLPPAALDPVHAGGGLRRPGAHEAGLRPRRRARDTASIPTATVVCCGDERFLRAAGERRHRAARPHRRPRTGRSRRRPSCRWRRAGTVKAMLPQSVAETGAEIVLGNTFHLMLRPGAERVASLGGLHKFMNWPGPDPHRFGRLPGDVAQGAAQARRRTASPSARRSTAREHRLTPERSIEIQRAARRRHHHVVRRMHQLAGRGGGGRGLHAAVDEMGRARQARLRRARRATACSASCRAAPIPSLRAESVGGAHRHRLRRLCRRRPGGR